MALDDPARIDALRSEANLDKFRGGVVELLAAYGHKSVQPTIVKVAARRAPPLNGIKGLVGLGTFGFSGALGEDINLAPFLDTAETYGYGRVERQLGEIGVEVPVASKFSRSHQSYRAVKNACKRSLKAMGLDHLWLYQAHWPSPNVPWGETFGALEDLKSEGLIEHWGVCNFSVGQLEQLASMGYMPSAVQVRYNMVEREAEDFLIPYCQERGITVIAYSPLGQNYAAFKRALPDLEELAKKWNRPPVAYALQWVLRHRGILAIPATNSREHLMENLEAAHGL